MTIFEQNDVLKSFEILCDSREQDTARARKRYASFGVPFKNKVTLSYGDYAYNATLPDGTKIYDDSKTFIVNKDIEEVVSDITAILKTMTERSGVGGWK